MNSQLTQKQLGKRISNLRKSKGLSQEELAKRVNISRPSLTQIELGKRCIDIFELKALSQALSFSLDDIMSNQFQEISKHEVAVLDEKKEKEERVAKVSLDVVKFKNVLLYVLEHCAGKPNVGETVLYKLLYFSDFNYYELYEEHLTGASYRKLPFGPVPQKIDILLNQLIDSKMIQRIKTEYHGFTQTRFIPLEKADLTQFKASEKDVIDKVLEQMSEWSAASISAYSHKDLPWEVTEEGKEISYELAFYREKPYSVRNYNDEKEGL